jgi:hypothetical protein
LENSEPVSAITRQTPRGYCWVSTMSLELGMVIARPVVGGSGGRVTIRLAAGSEITASTISQFINKGVDCVAVVQEMLTDDTTHVAIVEQYELRLREIFGANPDEDCRPLLDALLEYGP